MNPCYEYELVSLLKFPARISIADNFVHSDGSLSHILYSFCSFHVKNSILQCKHDVVGLKFMWMEIVAVGE